jgi:hypothetical protein
MNSPFLIKNAGIALVFQKFHGCGLSADRRPPGKGVTDGFAMIFGIYQLKRIESFRTY